MAVTTVSSNDTTTGKIWAEKYFRKMGFETITNTLMTTTDNGIICVKRDLEKNDGDRVRFHIFNELGGEFIVGSTSLEGQEQRLTWAYQDVYINEYKIGVRVKNGIDLKRSIFPITAIAEERLKLQVAKLMDKHWFAKMFATTFTKTVFPVSTYATVDDLVVGDSLNFDLCSRLKYACASGFQAVNQTVNMEPFRPLQIEGGTHFVLLVHPYVAYSLVRDPAYQLLMRECMERAKTNPLFTGAIAILDGVVIKVSNYIPLLQNAAGVWYARCLFLGAQASCWAWGKQMEIVNKAFGYAEEEGWGAKLLFETERTKFTAVPPGYNTATPPATAAIDYGCVEVDIACTNLGV